MKGQRMSESKPMKRSLSSYGRLGVLLAAIGVILAVDTMMSLTILYKLWPLLSTVLGIGFIGIYMQRSRREASYIGLGVLFIGFSGLALYCNFTTWSMLSVHWPLFIALLGITMITGFIFGNRSPVMLLSALLFLSLATVFYLVFTLSHRLWWSIFLLTGGSLYIFDKVRRSR